MSLQLKISATELDNSFAIYDCTGTYSSGGNPGGWGYQNPSRAEVTKAWFKITAPGFAPKIVLISPEDMPTETVGYEILPYMLDLKKIFSGEYVIQYFVEGTTSKGVTFSASTLISEVFIKDIQRCVCSKQKVITKDAFKNPKERLAIELTTLLWCAEHDKCEGLNSQANEIIQYLNAQCACVGC